MPEPVGRGDTFGRTPSAATPAGWIIVLPSAVLVAACVRDAVFAVSVPTDTPTSLLTIASADSVPPNDISPSPTTKAGEYAPRLMFKGRAKIAVAALRASSVEI
jgi:hypothetical protein